MSAPARFAAVIVAAGGGSRLGGGQPKQFRELAGKPVLRWSAETLAGAGASPLVVVVAPGQRAQAEDVLSALGVILVEGGAVRADSVRNGLAVVPKTVGAVLVHDAARPFVRREHVDALLEALDVADGALPALAIADTLKRAEAGRVLATEPRDGLWRAQTPQAFRRQVLVDAYAALPAGAEPTDDADVVQRAGGTVAIVPGDPDLAKLTYPEDFAWAERVAGGRTAVRVGLGLDAHRFEAGEAVMLCGVRVPHDQGLQGHSDADVGLHAITDALLGAAGLGDIGDWFPPSDPRWRGADSSLFLTHALELVRSRGGRVVNVDVTIVGERPKVKPYREAMRERVAAILELPLEQVSVKATTTEGMGFTGRQEGLAAQAVAAVEMPLR